MKKDLVSGVLSIICATVLIACCLYDIENRLDGLRNPKQAGALLNNANDGILAKASKGFSK